MTMTNNCPQPPPRRRASLMDELARSDINTNNQYPHRTYNHDMRGSFTFGRRYSIGEGEVMIEGKRVTTTNKGRRFRRFSFDRNDEAKQNLGDGELLWQLVVLLLLFVINVRCSKYNHD